ncbi:MAG: O-antigen ligase family protein [Cellvibrionales bacterium]|nr:O-antigen ligase family protein [Cellvibrionales bacterium]
MTTGLVDVTKTKNLALWDGLTSALAAFCFTVAFFLPDFSYYLFYLLMLLSLTIAGQLSLMNVNQGIWRTLFKAHKWGLVGVFAWLAFMTLSLINVWVDSTVTPRQYQMSALRYIYDVILLAFVFMLARLFLANVLKIEKLLVGLALGFAVLLCIQVGYFYQFSINAQDWFAEPPLAPHIRDQGNLACVIAVSFLAWWIVKKPKAVVLQGLIVITIWMGLSFIFWAGGRAAMAATVITCLLLVTFYQIAYRRGGMKALGFVVLMLVLGVVSAEMLSVYPWNGLVRFVESAEDVKSVAASSQASTPVNLNHLTTGRMHMWSLSLKGFFAEPWLGLGPYGYFFIPERVYDDQPHNFIIQFLVEWGVLGAGCLMALMLWCFAFVFKTLPSAFRENNLSMVIAAAIICVLTLHGLTGGTYFKLQPLTFLSIAYAVVLGEYIKVNAFASNDRRRKAQEATGLANE